MSETQTLTLTDFLLARIAEDEAVANEARPDEYLRDRDDSELAVGDRGGYSTVAASSGRVLAECEAKRRIVEQHGPYRMASLVYCSSCGDVPQVAYPCDTLRALAAVYANHPDYREEWRP